MILSRVIAHVREQNWTAIGIDFLIVVLGVFVATEVSDWKADRADGARSAAFTARLLDDLRYEAWRWEYLLCYYADALAGAETALARLSGDPSVSDEAFLIGAYRATQFRYNQRWRATYDELVSTGEIRLIENDTLRSTAADVYTNPLINQITENSIDSEYRTAFRRLVPADVQRALLRSCGDRTIEEGDFDGVVGSLGYPCALDLPPERVAVAASALRSDPAVLPALQLRFADLETIVTALSQNYGARRAILRRIAGLDPPPATPPSP